jgi:hypothetical protein
VALAVSALLAASVAAWLGSATRTTATVTGSSEQTGISRELQQLLREVSGASRFTSASPTSFTVVTVNAADGGSQETYQTVTYEARQDGVYRRAGTLYPEKLSTASVTFEYYRLDGSPWPPSGNPAEIARLVVQGPGPASAPGSAAAIGSPVAHRRRRTGRVRRLLSQIPAVAASHAEGWGSVPGIVMSDNPVRLGMIWTSVPLGHPPGPDETVLEVAETTFRASTLTSLRGPRGTTTGRRIWHTQRALGIRLQLLRESAGTVRTLKLLGPTPGRRGEYNAR